jgi:type II secretory pathway pseudopilin PulG
MQYFPRMARRRRRSPALGSYPAFTLVELLVVIGIIAVLIGLLLPVLSKARRVAQTTKCMATERSIGQAMQLYAAENKGWIMGSSCTTGLAIFPNQFQQILVNATPPAYGNGNIPGGEVIYPSDYMTPMIELMKLLPANSPILKDPNESNRFFQYVQLPAFQCPAFVDTKVNPNGSTWAGTVQAPSYVTAWAFLMVGPFQASANLGGVTGVTRMSSATGRWPQLPPEYVPKLNKVGDASKKIYLADGAKGFIYKSTFGTTPFPYGSYDLTMGTGQWYDDNNGSRGSFTDLGPWSLISGAYDRTENPADGNKRYPSDPRIMAYRHGGTKNGQFKLNAVFYDGHGETLSELDSADPAHWLPKGTQTPADNSGLFVYPDVIKTYTNNSATGVYIPS